MYKNWKVLKSVINYIGDDEEKQAQAHSAQEEYTAVAEWCNESGKYSIEDDGTYYKVVALPEPTPADKGAQVRAIRDAYINDIEWRVSRYRDQKELGRETDDDEETYLSVLEYMQYLRDIPEQPDFPNIEVLTFDEWRAD